MTVHVVLPPRKIPMSGCYYAECLCGHTAVGATEAETREGMAACRAAADAKMPPPRWTWTGRSDVESGGAR